MWLTKKIPVSGLVHTSRLGKHRNGEFLKEKNIFTLISWWILVQSITVYFNFRKKYLQRKYSGLVSDFVIPQCLWRDLKFTYNFVCIWILEVLCLSVLPFSWLNFNFWFKFSAADGGVYGIRTYLHILIYISPECIWQP